AGLAQFVEEKKTPKNAKKAVRVPQGKSNAQADVADGENRKCVGDRPKTSGKKRPNDQVWRAANVGADGRSPQDQRWEAPAREKDADDHDERNDHRGNADRDELCWRFG